MLLLQHALVRIPRQASAEVASIVRSVSNRALSFSKRKTRFSSAADDMDMDNLTIELPTHKEECAEDGPRVFSSRVSQGLGASGGATDTRHHSSGSDIL